MVNGKASATCVQAVKKLSQKVPDSKTSRKEGIKLEYMT